MRPEIGRPHGLVPAETQVAVLRVDAKSRHSQKSEKSGRLLDLRDQEPGASMGTPAGT